MILKLAIKELWASRRQLALPSFALALAVASLFILNAVQYRVEQLLVTEARNSMGADLEIDSLQQVGQDELERVEAILPPGSKLTTLKDFNTMMRIRGSAQARFVRAQVIEEGFPFYGEFELEPQIPFGSLNSKDPSVFIPQSVADIFDLEVGDKVQIGSEDFEILSLIVKRPGALGAALSFAPSVYFHDKFLDSTGLLDRPGRVDYEELIYLEGESAQDWVEPVQEALQNPVYEVQSYDSDERGFAELFDRFKLFGQIVGLAALLIASFSIYGTFQTWFRDRKFMIAILRSSGASTRQIQFWTYSSVLFLAVVASASGVFIGMLAEGFLAPFLQSVIQFSTEISLPVSIGFSVFLIGVLMTFFFSLLAMAEVEKFKPLLLLRAQVEAFNLRPQRIRIGLLVFLSFFLFAWYFTSKLELTLYLTGGILALVVLALFFNVLLFHALQLTSAFFGFAWKYSVRSLTREYRGSLTNASLLFLISSCVAIVLSLETALMNEFEVDPNTPSNSFFIFDMGDEDKEQVESFMKDFPAMQAYWLPSLTLRWLEWNGKTPYETDENFFDQEIRMMIVDEMPKSNFVVNGEHWERSYKEEDGPVGVSIAKNYAFVRGIHVGDQMRFELYGVEFDAVVRNLRAVRFLDFRPNARFMFQKGFFEGLPFNWYASIEGDNESDYLPFMKSFFENFQTISLIDLSEVRKDLIALIMRLRTAIFFILMFLVVVSVGLLAAFAREKVGTRRIEIATLKCFGASQFQLIRLVAIEFALLALLPSLAGALLGFGVSGLILQQFFSIFVAPWTYSLFLIPLACLLFVESIGMLVSYQLFQIRPKLLLADH